MYIEHPYFYEGKYYANIDGEMIEITKEVAYAMNNFYRSSKAKKVEIKNELGEVVDKMLREVPYSGQSIDEEGFMIEDFPDLNCDVEHSVLTKMEQQDIHKVIDQLNTEERMIIYGIFFENKTQMAEIMGISRQVLAYKLMVNVQKYQIVALGDTVSECEESYTNLMYKNGIKTEAKDTRTVESIKGKITKIAQGVVDGNSHYYLMLEGSDEIFDVSVVDFIDIIRYNVGDEVTVEYKEGEKANTVLSLTGDPK